MKGGDDFQLDNADKSAIVGMLQELGVSSAGATKTLLGEVQRIYSQVWLLESKTRLKSKPSSPNQQLYFKLCFSQTNPEGEPK